LYVTGYDSSFGNLAVGNIVHSFAFRHLCEMGIKIVDFMTDVGHLSYYKHYKQRWTNTYLISLRHLFVKKSLLGRLVGIERCLMKKP
jgi:CelD/BcsL family acetyltransferase involved in cellulose biosynthesis